MTSCEFCGAVLESGATTCSKCGSAVRTAVKTAPKPVEAPFQQLGSTAFASTSMPVGAMCAVHPSAPAAFICKRCGSFACRDCTSYTSGEGYCQKCNVSVGVKATRTDRFVANLVDNAVVILLPVLLVVVIAIVGAAVGKGGKSDDLMAGLIGLGALAAFGAGCAAQIWSLSAHGQSIGKRMMKIKVVRSNGEPCEMWRLILMRNVLIHVIAQLCGLVGLVDALMIFGEEQKCLHDLIADTIVVVAE